MPLNPVRATVYEFVVSGGGAPNRQPKQQHLGNQVVNVLHTRTRFMEAVYVHGPQYLPHINAPGISTGKQPFGTC